MQLRGPLNLGKEPLKGCRCIFDQLQSSQGRFLIVKSGKCENFGTSSPSYLDRMDKGLNCNFKDKNNLIIIK